MQRVDKNVGRERRPRLRLDCVSREFSFNISEEFTRAAQLPIGLKSNWEKQQQLLHLSSENLFTITSSAKTANSIKTFRCFGMTWWIQVEVTLAPIQGRWYYDRLLRKKNCRASVINSWITMFWIAFFRLVWNKPSACFQLLESCVIIVSFTFQRIYF